MILKIAIIPSIYWSFDSTPDGIFTQLLKNLQETEKRLTKEANSKTNQRRYLNIIRSLEAYVTEKIGSKIAGGNNPQDPNKIVFITLESSFLPGQNKIVISPNLVKGYLESLSRQIDSKDETRLSRFSDLALSRGAGLIILEDIYTAGNTFDKTDEINMHPERIEQQEIFFPLEIGSIPVVGAENEYRQEIDILRLEVNRAISQRGSINIGNFHHPAITEVLHELEYADYEKSTLGIIFEDGSKLDNFPIGELKNHNVNLEDLDKIPPLKFALMSVRHPEMDSLVDAAWFSNRSVSKRRISYAETEKYCYETSLKQFRLLPVDGLTVINIYQTGLVPAVLGFYHALVDILANSKKEIAVRPQILQGKVRYKPLDWWI